MPDELLDRLRRFHDDAFPQYRSTFRHLVDDGQHPTTNQFLWQPLAASFYAPCVDGAYDFSVFGHEYGHLIENRMIGKGVGARQGRRGARDPSADHDHVIHTSWMRGAPEKFIRAR